MTIAFTGPGVTLHHGDCIEVMRGMPDASVHAVVTDPPYGLEFMGKAWDSFGSVLDDPASVGGFQDGAGGNPFSRSRIRYGREGDAMPAFQAWCTEWAREALRILKPGGHLLAFGGSRTWHRLAAGIEDAGFEVRDSIAWLYGSGFPKSMDVSKAIDKAAGAVRDVIGVREYAGGHVQNSSSDKLTPPIGTFARVQDDRLDTAPATNAAREWEGWGTALKPAFEPIVVARKPLMSTVAANVLAHGTGALNIDGTRTAFRSDADRRESTEKNQHAKFGTEQGQNAVYGDYSMVEAKDYDGSKGRWPSNVLLDESQADVLDRQSGATVSYPGHGARPEMRGGRFNAATDVSISAGMGYTDAGGASRFFPTFRYEAKAPTSERPRAGEVQHPTVKPLDLMRWLVRLVTPPGGTILEPFAGSGTTLEAALIEGFEVIGIEREGDYLPLIEARITKPLQPTMFGDWDGDAA